jgi:hypothetical protein
LPCAERSNHKRRIASLFIVNDPKLAILLQLCRFGFRFAVVVPQPERRGLEPLAEKVLTNSESGEWRGQQGLKPESFC